MFAFRFSISWSLNHFPKHWLKKTKQKKKQKNILEKHGKKQWITLNSPRDGPSFVFVLKFILSYVSPMKF